MINVVANLPLGAYVKKDATFNLRKPCANCPFRNDDKAIPLHKGRREEIIGSLVSGREASFICHKTLHTGGKTPTKPSVCPGAAAVSRKMGRDTVIIQLAMRMGVIDDGFLNEALKCTIEPEYLDFSNDDIYFFSNPTKS